MKIRWVWILIIFMIVAGLSNRLALAAPQRANAVISADLAAELSTLPAGGQVSAIVTLKDQIRPDQITGGDKEDKRRNLLKALRNQSDQTQQGIRAYLKNNRLAGKLSKFTPLWITNAVALTASSDVINALATFPEVASITPDALIAGPSVSAAAASTSLPAANLNVINAPALWKLGYQGQNIVIASLDTGVDISHPDLSAQYRGGTNSWFDPYGEHSSPADLNGHGTWTMGVMVGGGKSGTILGVAPQARWIAAKIFDDKNVASTAGIHMSFQWLLDPDNNPLTNDAPNVVNNSWDLGSPGCNLTFEPDIQALVAANISVVFSAGNDGPASPSDVSPANNPNVFAVGASDNSDLIASFSSRGPTRCGRAGSATFPDVVAPGVAITTTDLFGLYNTVSGTSFAAPHLSGGIALLLNAIPGLNVSQLYLALTYTAKDLGSLGADASYGNGRINLLAAYNALKGGTLPTLTPTPVNTSTPTPSPATATPLAPTPTPGPTATATSTLLPIITPTPADVIFADGFETGSFSAWSQVVNPANLIMVSSAAAQPPGHFGMATTIHAGRSGYVVDNSPANTSSYYALFFFNPNHVAATGGPETIFAGKNSSAQSVFQVQYQSTQSGSLEIRGAVTTANNLMVTAWIPISSSFHPIEVRWESGANASFSLYIDGAIKQTLTGLNTSASLLKSVWLGPSDGLNGVSGSEYFDAFSSTRQTYIVAANQNDAFSVFLPELMR